MRNQFQEVPAKETAPLAALSGGEDTKPETGGHLLVKSVSQGPITCRVSPCSPPSADYSCIIFNPSACITAATNFYHICR